MKMVREYRIVEDNGGVFIEYRNVGEDGTSGRWIPILTQRGDNAKNYRSEDAAFKFIKEKVDAGDAVWENGAADYFMSQVKWTDDEVKRLEFQRLLHQRGQLNEGEGVEA